MINPELPFLIYLKKVKMVNSSPSPMGPSRPSTKNSSKSAKTINSKKEILTMGTPLAVWNKKKKVNPFLTNLKKRVL